MLSLRNKSSLLHDGVYSGEKAFACLRAAESDGAADYSPRRVGEVLGCQV